MKSINIWNYRTRWELSCRIFTEKNYFVHGVFRRSSAPNTQRIDHLIESKINKENSKFFNLHYGDLTDSNSIIKILQLVKLMEKYIIWLHKAMFK